MASPAVVKTYITCAAVLYVKFVLATGIQAKKTFAAGARPPEDKSLRLAKGNPTQNYGLNNDAETKAKLLGAKAAELRWRSVIQNDLEALPMGLLVFGAGLLVPSNSAVQIGAMSAFTFVRCTHTVAYAYALYPWRSLSWLFGVLSIVTGIGNALYGAFLA
jgi:glutathione S-transferase